MKKSKTNEIILKAAREKRKVPNKETHIRLLIDVSMENFLFLENRREWNNINQNNEILKTCQPRILYLVKLSFTNEGRIKTPKQKLREFITTRPASQEMLKGVFERK